MATLNVKVNIESDCSALSIADEYPSIGYQDDSDDSDDSDCSALSVVSDNNEYTGVQYYGDEVAVGLSDDECSDNDSIS